MVLDSRSRIDSPEAINSNGATPPNSNNGSNNGIDLTVATIHPSISVPTAPVAKKNPITSWWISLGLRTKTAIVSVAAITLPLLALGGFTYVYIGQSISDSTKQDEATKASGMSYRVAYFMRERYGDIQILSRLSFLTTPKVQAVTTPQERQAVLNDYVKSYVVYDSIAAFDVNGDVIAQSQGDPLDNHKERAYFKEVIRTGAPVVSQPEISKSSGKISIHLAAPIKDVTTGKLTGVIRARMPVESLDQLISDFAVGGEQYHLAESDGKFFLATEKEQIGRVLKTDFPGLASLVSSREVGAAESIDLISNKNQFAGYAPLPKVEGLPDLKWDAVIAIDTDIALKPVQQLLLILAVATGGVSIVAAVLAFLVTQRATRPIIEATEAVVELGKGNLDTRLAVKGEDEMAQLGSNINLMAGQLQDFIALQEEQKKQSEELAEKERLRSESIQRELITLLSDVEGAVSGDLTVRAQISAGEIGIVADFFNAIVESLRDVVTQVKLATLQVNTSVNTNNESIRSLAQDATLQAEQLDAALQSVEQMTNSIQQVASNARQAADASTQAANTAETGSLAIEQSAASILQLRQTVAETTKKVKRLGEASQQISKVVVLIDQIALKTNMLAVNASIEAARAGEEGRGFAVVAEEVGALAAQSATATKEIARIVESIQQETSEVVESMEASTLQVVEGTNKVEDARKSLSQIVQVATRVNELFQGISIATTSQVQTSQSVKQVMENLSTQSQKSSETSREVAIALQETANVASKLQASVETFKVDAA
jgi:methyl-accepting chemotaxis protein PixJ